MQNPYPPGPPQPPYNVPANDAGYRREPPPYHPPPPTHQQQQQHHIQNGQQYAYPQNPNIGPGPPQRPPMPEQVQTGENGAPPPYVPLPQPTGTIRPAEPASHSMVEFDRRYKLDVVQQPKRARMCGFGDKDRRPITPPPCIRLIITDEKTGAEIDVNDIDHGMFVLNVDLWSADGLREVNLVRHSATSPAIGAVIASSYAQAQAAEAPSYVIPPPVPSGHANIVREPQYPYHFNQQQAPPGQAQQPYNPYPQQSQVNPYGQGPPPGQYGQPSLQHPQHPGYHSSAPPGMPYNPNDPLRAAPITTSNPTGMFTRNLIGSLAASAFRLTDTGNKIGIWFVLQDLSVRTEGTFRLRFSFVNVGEPSKTPNGNPSNQNSIVNTGKSPILASCFSEEFIVFSAKKFPGVVESTMLSKTFAGQGIKIPIRKDGPRTNRDEYDED